MSIFIIAEAGVNHNGSLEIAKHLVDIAADAGADAGDDDDSAGDDDDSAGS